MEDFILWCKKEVQKAERQLEWLKSDSVVFRSKSTDGGWVDEKPEAIASAKRVISELSEIINRHSKVG